MNPDLPFTAEYSKSNRAACKVCKIKIEKDELRMGIMVQSPHFDGKIPYWHHLKCFFEKKKLTLSSVAEIANFDNLRWDDQKNIKESIGKIPAGGGSKAKGGKVVNSEFSIEYSKTARAACKTCGEKILKGEIRISKLITDTPEAHRYGPMPGWRHVDCFVESRLELEYSDSAAKLPGFTSLKEEDQKMVSEKLGGLSLKRKAEDKPVLSSSSKKLSKEDKLLKSQNDQLFQMIDKIKSNLSKKEMTLLLEHNNQYIPAGPSRICECLADFLVFGSTKICPECKSSKPRYKIDGYRCSGNLTEWTRCQYVTRCPEREPFKIPEEFKEKYDFLKNYKYVKRDRLLPEKEDASVALKKGPLNNCIVAVFGKFSSGKTVIEKKVMEFGGAISPKINHAVHVCISTEKEVAKDSDKVKLARSLNIHIVSPKFLEDIKKGSAPSIAMKDNLICSWGEDPLAKFGIKQEFVKITAPSPSDFSSSKSVSQTVRVHGGAAVDPESGKEDTSHVYQKKDNIYNAVLGLVDLSRGTNSYYKLQILESNKMKKFWLFRSWGRVGTTIGKSKLEGMKNAAEAIELFEALYLEKTGNEWSDRKNFVKQPGLFYPLDIDYGQEMDTNHKGLKASSESKLPMPVQELICLIFDIEAMKKAMIEFEIDLKKMPLGKLSKKQIENAYKVLNEAQQIIVTGCNSLKVLDASNRFYTLIPHDFGLKRPTLLDNEELIKSKIEMLDSLLEIEFAYNMLSSDTDAKDPVSVHYKKLKTDIEVLDNTSDEFNIIKSYVKNTHAETHNQYKLVLNRVFKINRYGENEKYQKFKSLHNKKLLWHGSRITNYVGILSQGLRIAPPEAPVTGYMFGKGIYFADMVSKSANYCFTTKKNPTGLLLLCEVALGDMYERTNAEYVEKLPPKKHSTKGLGMTIPDPKEKTFIGDVEVPYGKPVKSNVDHSSLLYNEYIVYDVNQVNIKYLLDVSFKWKH